MDSSPNGSGSRAYRPTSLDFINRPNPVEPHAVPEKHPLNDTQRLEKTSHQEFLRLLIDQNGSSNAERPAKRRKSGDAKLLDLPKLPAVRSGTKRLRIPPTLSGLHQPPPNAGLLPSISTEQPVNLPTRNLPSELQVSSEPKAKPADPLVGEESKDNAESKPYTAPTKQKRKKWTDEETAFLLKGAARFGIGNWTQILNCPDYQFDGRTAIDLKDRFRVCCPDEYKSKRTSQNGKTSTIQEQPDERPTAEAKVKIRRPNRSDRKSSSELLQLGIKEPFEKSKRRRRTNYTSAEDEAILSGFKKHGNSWAAIRQDPRLKLSHRRATDLRDRFRTKYPEQYEKAGLAPRREPESKKAPSAAKDDNAVQDTATEKTSVKFKLNTDAKDNASPNAHQTDKENKPSATAAPPRKQAVASLLHFDPDVFWGAPFDVDETEPERLTLDRRILDWPSETAKASASENTRYDADSLLASSNHKQATLPSYSAGIGGKTSGAVDTLPSLADITAGSEAFVDHLELPSLMGAFANLDGDGKTLPSLEELWK